MEDKLIMLGTGNAHALNCYNTCFALYHDGAYFLVDAGGGNGILKQLQSADIPLADIHSIFITHGHTDHILGAIWVVRGISTLINKGAYEGTFNIYCHDEVADMLVLFLEHTLHKRILKNLGSRIVINEIQDGETIDMPAFRLTAFDIDSKKAKQYGFKAELKNGKSLVCLGDEPFSERNRSIVSGCDYLLCEAFCLFEDRDWFKPYEKHHSTAQDAGQLAESLGAKNLLLYHTEDSDLENRKKRYTSEARIGFRGNIFVPLDLEVIPL